MTNATTQTEMVYTVKEVSKILKCGVNYVYKLIQTGQLQCMRIGSIKVRKSTLEDFLARWEGYDLTDPSNPSKLELGACLNEN